MSDLTRPQRGEEKVARNPVKVDAASREPLRKPPWIRVRLQHSDSVSRLKGLLRRNGLHTVCEEAACPNLQECFGHGTATFMIMGDICTRRCPFCDVAHGRPKPLDGDEPTHLAQTVAAMALRYVVITSVDRDDLRDGGAAHFSACVAELRSALPMLKIEVLVPDFRGRMDVALGLLKHSPPDVFNHNLETIPRLYKRVRPGADYAWSLRLLSRFKDDNPSVSTKSGLMVGLGESRDEVLSVLHDLRANRVDMLTIGQYLQPSRFHLPVERYWRPEEFVELGQTAKHLGFDKVASGPMVRSSYHADLQAAGETVA